MEKFEDMKQGISLKCPHCASALIFNPDTKKFVCEVCGGEFLEENLSEKTDFFKEQETFDETLKEYHCPSCGAELFADENTTTEFCAYCGNPVVLMGRVSGKLRPNLIIPFSISKQRAKEIIIEYLEEFSYIPKSFYKESNLEKITGIYYPFWESDINSDSSVLAECTTSRTWVSGNKEYTETSFYDVRRTGKIHFEDISVNALKSVDKKLVESVLPYPIEKHEPFKMSYLSGFYAKKNDLVFEDIREEVFDKLNSYSEKVLKDTMTGYTSIKVNSKSANILDEKHDYTLLPIWILSYKYRGKDYIFAVNGVTGKVFGEIPISKAKLGLTFAGVASAVAGIILFFALLGGV